MKKNFTFIKEKIKKQIEQLKLEMSSAATQEDYKTYSEFAGKLLRISTDLRDIEATKAAEKTSFNAKKN